MEERERETRGRRENLYVIWMCVCVCGTVRKKEVEDPELSGMISSWLSYKKSYTARGKYFPGPPGNYLLLSLGAVYP